MAHESNQSVEGWCEPQFNAVRDAFQENIQHGDLGASCAVSYRGELVVDLWGGHRDIARTEAWQGDTVVNLWSSTKMLSALCVLMLHDREGLSVDAPMAEYWPEFAAQGKHGILVRHVLGHTAGLPVFDKLVDEVQVFDWPTCCRQLEQQSPRWPPGEGSGYHAETQGWLLGELVRRVDGRSLGSFFHQEVARPLGLDLHIGLADCHFHRVAEISTDDAVPNQSPDAELMRLAQAASRRSLALVNTDKWRRAEFPSSNAHGNARSLALAMTVLANEGRVGDAQLSISPDTIARAFEVQADGIDRITGRHFKLGMGFGLNSEHTPLGVNDRTLWWAGWGGSMTVVDVENRLTVSYAMNKMAGEGDMRAPSIIFAAHACAAAMRHQV